MQNEGFNPRTPFLASSSQQTSTIFVFTMLSPCVPIKTSGANVILCSESLGIPNARLPPGWDSSALPSFTGCVGWWLTVMVLDAVQVAVETVLFNHSWRHLSDSPTAHFSKTLITRSAVAA